MILALHIVIALLSIIWTGYVFLSPSRKKLQGSYGLVAATLVSGTYLVVSLNSPLLKSCLTGLAYLGIVFAGIIATQYKLERAAEKIHRQD